MKTKLNKIMIVIITLMLCIVTNKALSAEFDVQKHLNKTYIKVGAGYKFNEIDLYSTENGKRIKFNDKWSAKIEIGYHITDRLITGYRHRSQLLSGWPLNDDTEYYVDELFIDYEFNLGDL